MSNTLLKDNPTIVDIKEFLSKIEDDIQNYSISFTTEDDGALIFTSITTQIIKQSE